MSDKPSRGKKACIYVPLILIGIIFLLVAASALSNLGLPRSSMVVDHLSNLEKAHLSEALNLRADLGDATWPGWSGTNIPIIVYNEKYAFLVGYPDPPTGWKKVPSMEQLGGPWEQVPDDAFESEPYYRTLLTDPEKTPQSFIVMVGDQYVATLQTREYSQINFYREFPKQLPPILSKLVPVRLVWSFLMGKTETYIGGLEHESFHVYEAILATGRLNASEEMYSVMDGYPFDGMESAWKQEMDVLVKAAQASTDTEARDLAKQFLELRSTRRASLSSDQVELERIREWEEGLAKYAELDLTRRAGTDEGYFPFGGISIDKDFKFYAGQEKFWTQQLQQAANVQGISGDTRFYYSGNAIAILLDRLMPGWKARALPGGEYPDVLLQEAVE
jgi:hypothetical protein